MHHGLAGLAIECLLELRHIHQHVVDAQFGHGVRIGQNHVPCRFRPDLIAPAHPVGNEETLQVGQAVRVLVLQRFALLFQLLDKR